jgi:glutaredoxin 3
MSDPDAKQAAEVTMYRTRGCPFCVAAERLLDAAGIAFDQVYLDDHQDRRAFTAAIMPGHGTVPLIVIDGQPIGGFFELKALADSGRLDAMLFPGGS